MTVGGGEGAAPSRDLPRELVLRDHHRQAGARFASFAGWEMPLQYAGIIAEHEAVRTRAGVFDVSHMGRVSVHGAEAARQIRSVTTYDVQRIEPGGAHYSLHCTEDGGIADDVFVYRPAGERWLVVHNAANAAAGLERLRASGASVEDATRSTVMLAVQGPEAPAALREVLGAEFDALEPRRCAQFPWRGGTALVARTGYTGEDGAECIVDAADGAALWQSLLAAGVAPAGLGARDTLRLEAALPLHGNDIDASTNPYEARLGWTVTLSDGAPFTGREALPRLRAEPPSRRLCALRLLERGVPRHGYRVLDPAAGGDEAGVLTSGAFSPTLRTGIGMAYLPVALTEPGTSLAVEIRGRAIPAEVVTRPFYKRPG